MSLEGRTFIYVKAATILVLGPAESSYNTAVGLATGLVTVLRPEGSMWKVSEAKRVLETLETKAGGVRTIVMTDLDRMGSGASPVLLKTLEEPDELTYFVLTSEKVLDPTLMGRVDEVIRVIPGRQWVDYPGVGALKPAKKQLAEEVLSFSLLDCSSVSSMLALANEVEELGKALGGSKNAKSEARKVAMYLLDVWADEVSKSLGGVDTASEFKRVTSTLEAVEDAQASLRTYGGVAGALGEVGVAWVRDSELV